MLWFFFKFKYLIIIICYNHTKSVSLFHRHWYCSYRDICFLLLVEIKHNFIIHLVNMVSTKNKNIFRIIIINIFQILEYRIGSTCIPLTTAAFLVWRKD